MKLSNEVHENILSWPSLTCLELPKNYWSISPLQLMKTIQYMFAIFTHPTRLQGKARRCPCLWWTRRRYLHAADLRCHEPLGQKSLSSCPIDGGNGWKSEILAVCGILAGAKMRQRISCHWNWNASVWRHKRRQKTEVLILFGGTYFDKPGTTILPIKT